MLSIRAVLPLFILMIASSQFTSAGDWPTWRGQHRDDISVESGLMTTWPEGGPEKIWTFEDAGIGYSSFAIVGDQLFTLGADQKVEHLMAVDTTTGKQQWTVPLGERLKNKWGDGPRSTPAVFGDRVVALGARGRVVCCSVADGAIHWETELTDLGGKIPNWGYSESPLIDHGRVMVTPGGDDGAMVAFNLESGDVVWQSWEVAQPAHYSSIIVAEHNGTRQYIQLGSRSLYGINAEDGERLWETKWPGKVAVVPTPIFHEGGVYVSSGYGVGCMMIQVGPDNAVTEVYKNKVMKNHHGGIIRVGDHVYGYSDGPGWICQNLTTGEMVWNEKRVLGKGAIACADGLFYCLEEKSGVCVLVSATPDGWDERGRLTIEPQTEQRSPSGRIWSHPVIANGRLYLRDQEIICCYDITASRQTRSSSGLRAQ